MEVPMLGFEHPSHMVTHPSTDEAQCCFTFKNPQLEWPKYTSREKKRKYKEHKVASMSGDLKSIRLMAIGYESSKKFELGT